MKLKTLLNTSFNFFKGYILNKKVPLSVTFYITYKCNFKCRYCNVWKAKEKEMTTEQIFSMIDQFSLAGTQRFGFTGGEPLLRDDIGELIEYSKKKGMITTLCSNGWLVPQKVEELRELDILILSFDGPERIHDKYRRKGSYRRIIEAIKKARENGIRVWVSPVITKENITKIDFLLKKARELDFEIGFQPIYNYSLSSNIDSLLPQTRVFRRVIKKLIKKKKEGAPLVYSLSFLKYLLKSWPTYNHSLLRCLAGKYYCVVSPGGNVYPCQPLQKYVKPANGLKLGFVKAFESIKDFKCDGCFCDSFIESNFLFSLDMNALFNALSIFKIL
jgi:MoaA/NifB/PqqE/SkfB family radical SAM enzyme